MKYFAKNNFECMYGVKVKKGDQLRKYKSYFLNEKGIKVCPVFSVEANENILTVIN